MVKTSPTPLTKPEMDALILASSDDDFYYMLFNTAKTTGRRLGEYYGRYDKKTGAWEGGVKVKDVDLDTGVMVTQVLKRRRHVEKEAILIPEVVKLIRQYIWKNKLKVDDYLFRKVGYRQIQNAVKHYAHKAGIDKNVSFHNFRHYFVTELFKQGWSYDKIAKLTGHSSPGTLVFYDSSVASDLKGDALKAVGDL